MTETESEKVLEIQLQVDELDGLIHFILNRLDGVAMDVVKWMPPEDNQEHHNAVDMLSKARQAAERLSKKHREISDTLGQLGDALTVQTDA